MRERERGRQWFEQLLFSHRFDICYYLHAFLTNEHENEDQHFGSVGCLVGCLASVYTYLSMKSIPLDEQSTFLRENNAQYKR